MATQGGCRLLCLYRRKENPFPDAYTTAHISPALRLGAPSTRSSVDQIQRAQAIPIEEPVDTPQSCGGSSFAGVATAGGAVPLLVDPRSSLRSVDNRTSAAPMRLVAS